MKYKITITSDFDNMILSGEFEAKSEKQAIEDCREYYASSLDTFPENIEILEIQRLGGE